MDIFRVLINIIFLLLAFLTGYSQEDMIVRQYNKSKGLSQNTVFDIAQDADGFIWLATREGLNKFDGRNFFVYRNTPSESSSIAYNDLRKLYWDKTLNKLWIATLDGLSLYDPVTDRFSNYNFKKSDWEINAIFSVTRDKSGRLWIGANSGLIRFDEKTNDFQFFQRSTDGYNLSVVSFVFQDRRDILWVGTKNGLFNITVGGKTIIKRADAGYPALGKYAGLYMQTIAEDKKGQIWLGTFDSGAIRFSVESHQILELKHNENKAGMLLHNNVRTILCNQDHVLLGTLSGLNQYDLETQRLEKVNLVNESGENTEGNTSIRSLFLDSNGGLWIGTFFEGVLYYDQRLARFQPINYIPDYNNVISSFSEDVLGRLWIGTEGGGLCIKGQGQIKKYRHNTDVRNSLCGNNIKCIKQNNGKFWIGTYQNGLCVTEDPGKGFQSFAQTPGNPASLSNNNVYDLLPDLNWLWVATYGGGLNRMNLKSKIFVHYVHHEEDSTSLSSDFCRVIFKDKGNRIWIGTNDGLNLLEEGEALFFKRYVLGVRIYSIQQTDSNGLWLGTFQKGLLYFSFRTLQARPVLGNKEIAQASVYSILSENNNYIWLSSNAGIFRFDIKKNLFNSFVFTGKLNTLEYNYNACFKASNGKYYFGTTDGYVTFSPDKFTFSDFKPPLVFTYLDVLGERVRNDTLNGILSENINYAKKIVFDYGKANFTIGFASLDYFNPQSARYAYKMDGIERSWVETGMPMATYTIQRPGEYTLFVKSTDGEGFWNPNVKQIFIEVRPPWWRSDTAYFVYCFLLFILGAALWQYLRLRHSFRMEQLVNQQQAEINKMKLNFFTNVTHEFRTPLTLILGPLKDVVRFYEGTEHEPKLKIILKNATRLLNLTNQLMSFRTLEEGHSKINVSAQDIVTFVHEIFLMFSDKAVRHGIRYNFKTDKPEIIVWYDKDMIEKVFYNLLSNAFKFVPEGGMIGLEISVEGNSVTIRVKDNGRGIKPQNLDKIFDRYYEDSTNGQEHGYGIGLAMSKDFIALHHGAIVAESQYGEGAVFTVQLPLGHEHFKAEELDLSSLKDNDIANYITLDTVENTPENAFADPKALTDDKDVLLIIEDNEEIAKYICSIFSGHFQVIWAANGKEGLKLAYSAMPGIIVSDVLMPEMDGITFCQRLKSELAISHIPVILLTARTSSLYEMEGLKIGADDYITKPFDPELLKLKVINIAKTRMRLYHKIEVDNSFNPREVVMPSPDQDFLARLFELIESNIENPEFDIEQFAQEIGLSRSLFFKKVKVLTNQTPKGLLVSMRLKRASQLLNGKSLSVSEVAYSVGFNDPKYFAKCFKKVYNVLPSEYKGIDED